MTLRRLFFLFFFLLFAAPVLAADFHCGADTDGNGSVDNACPGLDQDRDGYTSDGSLGTAGTTNTDCDDTNHYIYPGISTTVGATATNYRTCQTNGTYTSNTALSSFTCHTGSGSTYFIDDDETDCAGTGAYADEEHWHCMSNTGASGYHAATAGDCYVFKAGTYNDTWGSSPAKHIFLNNRDGTSGDNITFRVLPGDTWWEAGVGSGAIIDVAGTSPNSVDVFHFTACNYINVWDLEITNGAAGYANVGIHWDGGGTGGSVKRNYIHDLHGECGGPNCSGVSVRETQVGVEVDHNLTGNIYDTVTPNNQNTSDILFMDSDQFNVHHNYGLDADGNGYFIKIKHPETAAVGGNISDNSCDGRDDWACYATGGHEHTDIVRNYAEDADGGCFFVGDLGSAKDKFSDILISNNTCVSSASVKVAYQPDSGDSALGTPALTVTNNIFVSDKGSTWASSGDGGGEWLVCHYCANTDYASTTGGGLVIQNNCFYNSAAVAFLGSIFGSSSPGGSNGNVYTSWGTWIGAGWDSGSFNEDPSINADGQATSTNCDDWGWLPSSGSSTTTTSTTTTVSTITTTLPSGSPGGAPFFQ